MKHPVRKSTRKVTKQTRRIGKKPREVPWDYEEVTHYRLSMSDGGVRDETNVKAVCLALTKSGDSSVIKVDVEGGVLNEDLAKLTDALARNSTVTDLILSWNGLDEEGASFVSKMLTKNSTLLDVDLSCNRVGDVGAKEG